MPESTPSLDQKVPHCCAGCGTWVVGHPSLRCPYCALFAATGIPIVQPAMHRVVR